jgi:hypothetical protein
MLPNYLHVLVEQERRQDHLREAEHSRLVRAAKGQPARGRALHRAVAGQIGCQLVRLGRKIQSYGAVPRACDGQITEARLETGLK